MRRRSFIAGCSALAALPSGARSLEGPTVSREGRVAGPDSLDMRVVQDPEGASLLVRSREERPRPLVIVSHCLGRDPWDQISARSYDRVFTHLADAGYALLLSYDAGTDTYGNDRALAYNRRVARRAAEAFDWDGRILTLGISMGGLPALLAAYRGTLDRPVDAVALIAGVADLAAVHTAPADRRRRIEDAYGRGRRGWSFERASAGHDPLGSFDDWPNRATPVLAVASPQDSVVPISAHAEPLVARSRAAGAESGLVEASGPHVGRGHFTERIAAAIVRFFDGAAVGSDSRPPV